MNKEISQVCQETVFNVENEKFEFCQQEPIIKSHCPECDVSKWFCHDHYDFKTCDSCKTTMCNDHYNLYDNGSIVYCIHCEKLYRLK